MTTCRFDAVKLDGKTVRTSDGYLRVSAIVTKAGVFKYRRMDGSIQAEFRSPKEVLRSDSLESLKLVPMTNGHPPVGLLTAATAKKYQIGYTGETIKTDNNNVISSLVITDEGAINDIKDLGKRELSCGYKCDVAEEHGEYNGETYTHVQKNILYNHVAICTSGRAGSEASLPHFDSTDDISVQIQSKKENFMKEVIIKGQKCEVEETVVEHFDSLVSLETEKAAAASLKLDSVTAERDALALKVDELSKELEEAPTKFQARLDERSALLVSALTVLPKEEKLDSLSDKDIKLKVIAARLPTVKLDNASDDFLQGVYISALNSPRIATPADLNRMLSSGASNLAASIVKTDSKETFDVDSRDLYKNK